MLTNENFCNIISLNCLNESKEVAELLNLKSHGFVYNIGVFRRIKRELLWSKIGRNVVENVVKSFPLCCARFPPKAKKFLETLGFQEFVLVEISGIEPLTS